MREGRREGGEEELWKNERGTREEGKGKSNFVLEVKKW